MEFEKERKQAKRLVQKTTVLALVGALLVTGLCSAGGSAYGAVSQESASAQQSAASMMAAFGVISADESGSYQLTQAVTRGEFARMLVKASAFDSQVAGSAYSAPFSDVAADDGNAPYIRTAASNGILTGYSDGTFRPDASVSLAQAANSVLLLLGYESSDFRGAFPYAQMNLYRSTGLSDGIALSDASSLLTRGDAVQLLYNLMKTDVKDGSQTYAQSLGYALNSSGQVDYASLIDGNMYGPYTVLSATSWAAELGVDSASATLYKNGSLVTVSDISAYDILYYTADKSVIYAYDTKITGIYEKATPSQNNLTSVTVSGKTYEIETSAAFSALSAGGSLKVGDAVTLLLGKNGGVADAVAASQIDRETVIYVTQTGTKSYVDGNGNSYTSGYIKGVCASANEVEYAVNASWVSEGMVVSISVSDGSIRVNSVSGGSISGTVDASAMTIGGRPVADSVSIVDTYSGSYAVTGMNRLSGLSLSSADVLYSRVENGKITELILHNATGDAIEYGLILAASESGSGMNISGSYSYDLDGTVHQLNTSNRALNVSKGAAGIYTADGETVLRNLHLISGSVSQRAFGYAVIGGTKYMYSPEVKVYVNCDGDYRLGTIDDVTGAEPERQIRFYEDFDKGADGAGRVRVILVD